MYRLLIAVCLTVCAAAGRADVPSFPASFEVGDVAVNGVTLHVRSGGVGPAVVLIHGFGETGDMWAPLAAELMHDHLVLVPDLRGFGLSSRPKGGYDKKTQAEDIAGLLDSMHVSQADIVGHDIGNMVAFAFAASHPDRTRRLVVMDAPIPGIGPWEEVLKNPLLWHFHFGGPDMERLVAGRERIYLDRFWNEFSADPSKWNEASRKHYAALYAMPGAMHASFAQFAAFDQDAKDNVALIADGPLSMPVLAVGGEKSFGPTMATVMRSAANNVQGSVIADAGHWLMEEQPARLVPLVAGFLRSGPGPKALSAGEVDRLPRHSAGAGTSGLQGIETTLLSGDPAAAGPYAIEIRVPANTKIASHSHRDERFAMVVSGEWHFGYGNGFYTAGSTTLNAGGFYTEPAGAPHYAYAGNTGAVVYITGYGPTDTTYVDTGTRR